MINKLLPAVLLLTVAAFTASAQNIGINNTDPKVALDIKGGLATRTSVAIPSGNAVNIPANASFVIVSGGAATGTISCLYPSPYTDGQRMVIYNSNIGGYDLDFLGTKIPLNQGREFICQNPGGWTLLSGALNTEGWSLKGNAGTDTSVNFIGTTDNQPLKFKVNNQRAGVLDANSLNTAFGPNSYSKYNGNVDAAGNVAIGASSLSNDTIGNGNTAVGAQSMRETRSAGSQNTAVGSYSLQYNRGFQNSAFGSSAMEFLNTGNHNTALGSYAYTNKTDGTGNTAVGANSMSPAFYSATSGNYNTAVGMFSLKNNRTGSGAVAIGYQAAYSDTTGEGIIAIGRSALYNNNGTIGNMAIGDSALFMNGTGATDPIEAVNNLAIGSNSLQKNTKGYSNTAIGINTLLNNTTGYGNLAVGPGCLNNISDGYSNLAVNGLYLLSSGNQNVGILGLQNLNKGSNNIGIGSYSNTLLDSANRNIIIGNGTNALISMPTGDVHNNLIIGNCAVIKLSGNGNIYLGNEVTGAGGLVNTDQANSNVVVGDSAFFLNKSGAINVALGAKSGFSNRNGNANVFLGYSSGYNATSSNKLYIENSNADSLNALIYGDFAADSLLLNAKTVVRNNAVVKGFTKLGGYDASVPSIKMKKINIPAGPAVNAFVSYPLGSGITDAKVVGIQVLLNYAGTWKMPPGYIDAPGYEYNVQVQNNNVVVVLKNGNSANIGAKPISVIVTYEE